MEGLLQFNEWLSGVVWGWPMLLLLALAGAFFTARTRFVQLRRFGDMLRLTMGAFTRRKNTDPGEVSPLQAMTTALAATVGTGNIAGVAGAIALGGPGAVFWVWVSPFSAWPRSTPKSSLPCAIASGRRTGRLRRADVLYPRSGQGLCPARAPLCPARSAGRLGIGNMVQANTAAEAAAFSLTALFPALAGAPLRLFVGIILSLAVALALMGGAARIGRATEQLVPLMSALYACMALTVIVLRFPAAVRALGDIVTSAFSPRAALGGAAGIGLQTALRCGMERGMFSHEAGMGSAPHRPRGRADRRPRPAGPFRHLRGLCRHHRHLHAHGAGHPRKRRQSALWPGGGRGADHRRHGNGLWRRPRRAPDLRLPRALRPFHHAQLVAVRRALLCLSHGRACRAALPRRVHRRHPSRRGHAHGDRLDALRHAQRTHGRAQTSSPSSRSPAKWRA